MIWKTNIAVPDMATVKTKGDGSLTALFTVQHTLKRVGINIYANWTKEFKRIYPPDYKIDLYLGNDEYSIRIFWDYGDYFSYFEFGSSGLDIIKVRLDNLEGGVSGYQLYYKDNHTQKRIKDIIVKRNKFYAY